MLTLEEVKMKTDKVFEWPSDGTTETPTLPSPGPDWKRRLEALEGAALERQRTAAIFDMRCEQAETMGFVQLESNEIVKLQMGETHTDTKERGDTDRQTYEWMYDHHTGKVLEGKDCTWGGHAVDFFRMERKGLWYMPPFSKIEKWRCRFGKLDYLKRTIPYGVVLRMQEVKKLNLFNCFNVLAPIEAWERQTDIDPVVLATIWEIPPVEKDKGSTAGQAAHFFIAQW